MKLLRKLGLAIAGLTLAGAAHAYQLTYTFTGPEFTAEYGGAYSLTDKITGTVSFDSSKLDALGYGVISTSYWGVDPDITWQFQDAHNVFSNTLTTTNFSIALAFSGYAVAGWIIDPTWGYTTNSDIWFDSGAGSYESWYNGAVAYGPGYSITSSNWELSSADVPEPGTLALFLGGLGLVAIGRRRRA